MVLILVSSATYPLGFFSLNFFFSPMSTLLSLFPLFSLVFLLSHHITCPFPHLRYNSPFFLHHLIYSLFSPASSHPTHFPNTLPQYTTPALNITQGVDMVEDSLPKAHTCFNQLVLPPYSSFAKLKERILFAVANSEGFELA